MLTDFLKKGSLYKMLVDLNSTKDKFLRATNFNEKICRIIRT